MNTCIFAIATFLSLWWNAQGSGFYSAIYADSEQPGSNPPTIWLNGVPFDIERPSSGVPYSRLRPALGCDDNQFGERFHSPDPGSTDFSQSSCWTVFTDNPAREQFGGDVAQPVSQQKRTPYGSGREAVRAQEETNALAKGVDHAQRKRTLALISMLHMRELRLFAHVLAARQIVTKPPRVALRRMEAYASWLSKDLDAIIPLVLSFSQFETGPLNIMNTEMFTTGVRAMIRAYAAA
ncbi:MAG: hypothetical protein LBF66_00960 [Holosporales bacterium]|nr:hypothetical protein [Holosporales bacterium]